MPFKLAGDFIDLEEIVDLMFSSFLNDKGEFVYGSLLELIEVILAMFNTVDKGGEEGIYSDISGILKKFDDKTSDDCHDSKITLKSLQDAVRASPFIVSFLTKQLKDTIPL
jgi:hypothetical protein